MSYAWNKLQSAVHCLTAAGPQRERLAAAIAEHVASLRPQDLPSTWRPEFASVIDRFCLGRVLEQGDSVRQTVEVLEDDEVVAMIDSIVRLYDAVTRYQPIQASREIPQPVSAPLPLDKVSARYLTNKTLD